MSLKNMFLKYIIRKEVNMVKIKMKQLRKLKGWSQMKTAIELKVSIETVKSIESRNKFVSGEMLQKIYRTFNCTSFDEILEIAS